MLPLGIVAQVRYADAKDNTKYLKGAVQNIEGKAAIIRTIKAPKLTQAQISDVVDLWLKRPATPTSDVSKMVNQSSVASKLTVLQDWLVFKRNFINYDRAAMSAVLLIECADGECTVALTNIVYYYGSEPTAITDMPHEQWKGTFTANDNAPEIYKAEEQVTDDIALTSNGHLVRSLAKYRIATIDYVDQIVSQLKDDLMMMSTGVK